MKEKLSLSFGESLRNFSKKTQKKSSFGQSHRICDKIFFSHKILFPHIFFLDAQKSRNPPKGSMDSTLIILPNIADHEIQKSLELFQMQQH